MNDNIEVMLEKDKAKHAERIHQKQVKLKHKKHIASIHYVPVEDDHRLHKKSPISCGKSHCVMCGNPRRTWKEKTIQEKRFNQRKLSAELSDNND